jgi:NTP pyrophosphatase (non-canonical NTP hydrolase)
MLTMDEYQKQAERYSLYPEHGQQSERALNYTVMGLVGEAGEVANTYKKVLRGDNEFIEKDAVRSKLAAELGGVLWYVSQVATELGLRLDDIAAGNIVLLADRQRRNVIHGTGDNR